jgi:hypothetical protein
MVYGSEFLVDSAQTMYKMCVGMFEVLTVAL